MKLKEQLSGNGEVFKSNDSLGKINYNLYVYQETHNVNGEEIEGIRDIKGEISSEDAVKLFGKRNLILCLEDERCIEFLIRNTNGDIQCLGDFFKRS